MKTFEEFAIELYPLVRKQYEISLLSIEELIGRKVISIRSGFGGYAGVKMIITGISNFGIDNLTLIRLNGEGRYGENLKDVPTSLILLDEFKDLKVGDIFTEIYSTQGYYNRHFYKKINETQAIEPFLEKQEPIDFEPDATVIKNSMKII